VPHDYDDYGDANAGVQSPPRTNNLAPLQYTDAPPHQRPSTTSAPREPIFTFGPPVRPPTGTGATGYLHLPQTQPPRDASTPGAQPPFSASPWDEESTNWRWSRGAKRKKSQRAIHSTTTRGVPHTLPSRSTMRTHVGGRVTPIRVPRPASERGTPPPTNRRPPLPTYGGEWSVTAKPYDSRSVLPGYTDAKGDGRRDAHWTRRRKPSTHDDYGYADLTAAERHEADDILLAMLLGRDEPLAAELDYRYGRTLFPR